MADTETWFGGYDVMDLSGYGTGGSYMPADTVEEQASDTGMSGVASLANRGVSPFATPTRSLVALWVGALALYWFMGWYFKGARS